MSEHVVGKGHSVTMYSRGCVYPWKDQNTYIEEKEITN